MIWRGFRETFSCSLLKGGGYQRLLLEDNCFLPLSAIVFKNDRANVDLCLGWIAGIFVLCACEQWEDW